MRLLKLVLACSSMYVLTTGTQPIQPKLFFSYSWQLDRALCEAADEKESANWTEEARQLTPYLTQVWDQQGPGLLNALFEMFQRDFGRKEITMTLSFASKISRSTPPILNINRYRKQYDSVHQSTASDNSFVNLVFGILLFNWLDHNLSQQTSLEKKYSDEDWRTRGTLLCYALKKFIYLKAGRIDLLKEIEKSLKNAGACYKRSWEIIEAEGCEAFIRDIQEHLNPEQTPPSDLPYPRLFFNYGWLLDQSLADASNNQIKYQDLVPQLKQQMPLFTAQWEQDAPALFNTLDYITKQGFSRSEYTASLALATSCSFSDPLVINVRSLLEQNQTAPYVSFVDHIFHLLLRTWCSENINRPTPLLKKYQSEDRVTINHLHVFALKLKIYNELGRSDLIAVANANHSPSVRLALDRAWYIVTEIEGYEACAQDALSSIQ